MTSEGVAISVLLTPSDLARFGYFHLHRRIWPISLLLFLIFLTLGFITVLMLALGAIPLSISTLKDYLGFLFLILIWTALLIGSPLLSARQQLKSMPHLKTTIHYRFDSSGILMTGEGFQSQMKWQLINKAFQGKRLLLLYSNQTCAFVIPLRFFKSPTEKEAVEKFLVESTGIQVSSPAVVSRLI
ncbi:MAG: YcxB family protein [Bryobacter sp.]|nr:YcxB family protein [Bryobacter sp.]